MTIKEQLISQLEDAEKNNASEIKIKAIKEKLAKLNITEDVNKFNKIG